MHGKFVKSIKMPFAQMPFFYSRGTTFQEIYDTET